MCHAIVEFLGKFFFQSSKKTRGTGGTGSKIGYKCWYKRIVAVPRQFFLVAQVAHYTELVFRARDPFCFLKTFFALKFVL